MTTGVIKTLKCDSPVELDLSEHISGCNAISMGRYINTEKKVLYDSFASSIMDRKKKEYCEQHFSHPILDETIPYQ